MKFYSIVLVAIFFLAGSYHVSGMSCEDNLSEIFKTFESECNSGARADAFMEFNPSSVGLSAEGLAIAEKCIAEAKANTHEKCKRFEDLYRCYLNTLLCSHLA
uniref:LolSALOf n=1 Tax=Bichromomyia olmeca TaxID=715919 RepID=A0A1B1V3E9_9DIPT|nr:LolSALOf [Bichromomyia olmeca]